MPIYDADETSRYYDWDSSSWLPVEPEKRRCVIPMAEIDFDAVEHAVRTAPRGGILAARRHTGPDGLIGFMAHDPDLMGDIGVDGERFLNLLTLELVHES